VSESAKRRKRRTIIEEENCTCLDHRITLDTSPPKNKENTKEARKWDDRNAGTQRKWNPWSFEFYD